MIRKMILPIRLKPMFANRNSNLLVLMIVLVAMLFTSSCNKNNNTTVSYQPGIQSAEHFVYGQQMMIQLMCTYFKAIGDSILFAEGYARIDNADVNLITWETLLRLKFEYSWKDGTGDGYGHIRKGIYEAYTPESFHDIGSVIDVKFTDFLYDGDSVFVDSFRIENLGKVDGKNEQFEISVKTVSVQYPDSVSIYSYSFNEKFTLMKAQGTTYSSPKDSLELFGSFNGSTPQDVQFDAECIQDSTLLYTYSCNWLKNGVVSIETKDFPYLSTAYFSEPDTCENLYMIVIDNNLFPKEIELTN